VISAKTARQVRGMLESVSADGGTGTKARIAGYRVGGKTGTAKKSADGGYASNRYLALFAGFAPASTPRLVMVAIIDEPSGDAYYGGQVAAPIFGRVVGEALRILGVPPDDSGMTSQRLAMQAGGPGPHAVRLAGGL
jgi:cell division protein FtsI (penicillin-binding protein 3)